jgi:ArsR family metal-binding transcriptional regulator
MKLNVAQVLKNLPVPNCKDCGEATCMVFATKLVRGEKTLEDCRPLFAPAHAENLAALKALLAQAA